MTVKGENVHAINLRYLLREFLRVTENLIVPDINRMKFTLIRHQCHAKDKEPKEVAEGTYIN